MSWCKQCVRYVFVRKGCTMISAQASRLLHRRQSQMSYGNIIVWTKLSFRFICNIRFAGIMQSQCEILSIFQYFVIVYAGPTDYRLPSIPFQFDSNLTHSTDFLYSLSNYTYNGIHKHIIYNCMSNSNDMQTYINTGEAIKMATIRKRYTINYFFHNSHLYFLVRFLNKIQQLKN